MCASTRRPTAAGSKLRMAARNSGSIKYAWQARGDSTWKGVRAAKQAMDVCGRANRQQHLKE